SFPNPFIIGSSTVNNVRISYTLNDDANVSLSIFSAAGAKVRTLVDHLQESSGEQEATWDGTDDRGLPVASGVYYYHLETNAGEELSKKMILITK
ncbi:MAG: FlgD immunoglobulin-like domain containing protein, partial [Ignavibacteriota bacterium]